MLLQPDDTEVGITSACGLLTMKQTLLTGLIFNMLQLQQCEMRACRELNLHVFPQ